MSSPRKTSIVTPNDSQLAAEEEEEEKKARHLETVRQEGNILKMFLDRQIGVPPPPKKNFIKSIFCALSNGRVDALLLEGLGSLSLNSSKED